MIRLGGDESAAPTMIYDPQKANTDGTACPTSQTDSQLTTHDCYEESVHDHSNSTAKTLRSRARRRKMTAHARLPKTANAMPWPVTERDARSKRLVTMCVIRQSRCAPVSQNGFSTSSQITTPAIRIVFHPTTVIFPTEGGTRAEGHS